MLAPVCHELGLPLLSQCRLRLHGAAGTSKYIYAGNGRVYVGNSVSDLLLGMAPYGLGDACICVGRCGSWHLRSQLLVLPHTLGAQDQASSHYSHSARYHICAGGWIFCHGTSIPRITHKHIRCCSCGNLTWHAPFGSAHPSRPASVAEPVRAELVSAGCKALEAVASLDMDTSICHCSGHVHALGLFSRGGSLYLRREDGDTSTGARAANA
mmetsp:Transcript_34493/g.62514  ORF Transcript_34493/g.62514 Transcript_34493/m.62514 type:complete len:212 (-) Transcript_34493:343-978(-)